MIALKDRPHRLTAEPPAQPGQRQLVESLCKPGMLDSRVLTDAHIDQLATVVASFHHGTNRAIR